MVQQLSSDLGVTLWQCSPFFAAPSFRLDRPVLGLLRQSNTMICNVIMARCHCAQAVERGQGKPEQYNALRDNVIVMPQ